MSQQFVGEIRMVAFNFAPQGWALCQGQTLPISQNQALFAVLGTMYGGNGQTTFALPDMRDRAPIHVGSGFVQGQAAGEATHTLTTTEMPGHSHPASARASGTVAAPVGALWAASAKTTFTADPSLGTTMSANALGSTGANQAHDNMPPYLVLNFAIALVGVFPSRN